MNNDKINYKTKYLKYKKKYLNLIADNTSNTTNTKKDVSRFLGGRIKNVDMQDLDFKKNIKLKKSNKNRRKTSRNNIKKESASSNVNLILKGPNKSLSIDTFTNLGMALDQIDALKEKINKKGSIYEKISDYWTTDRSNEFFVNTETFAPYNSKMSFDEQLKKIIFTSNENVKYEIGSIGLMFQPNEFSFIWEWRFEDNSKKEPYLTLNKEIAKYPELEYIGLDREGYRSEEALSQIDELFYMLVLGYFLNGLGYFKVIMGPNNVLFYDIITSIKKL